MDDGNQNTGPGFPIKQFVRIDPADIVDAINILIVEINNLFAASGGDPFVTVTQKQMRTWLATHGSNPVYIYTVDNVVSALIANPINIAWDHANTMTINDDLYQFIQSTLVFSDTQMLLAFLEMQALPA